MSENCTLTKIYSFSATHRLNNDKFSKEKNIEILENVTIQMVMATIIILS